MIVRVEICIRIMVQSLAVHAVVGTITRVRSGDSKVNMDMIVVVDDKWWSANTTTSYPNLGQLLSLYSSLSEPAGSAGWLKVTRCRQLPLRPRLLFYRIAFSFRTYAALVSLYPVTAVSTKSRTCLFLAWFWYVVPLSVETVCGHCTTQAGLALPSACIRASRSIREHYLLLQAWCRAPQCIPIVQSVYWCHAGDITVTN